MKKKIPDIEWHKDTRKISELIENKRNPRRLSNKRADDLKKSLSKFGMCQPIVIQQTNKVIGGHQRLKLLHSLGYDEVDVVVPSRPLSEDESNELTIVLNKVQGEFDFDMLANQWDIDMLCNAGFTVDELYEETEKSDKPKKYTLTVNCDNEEDLHLIETEFLFILGTFPTATIKKKIK